MQGQDNNTTYSWNKHFYEDIRVYLPLKEVKTNGWRNGSIWTKRVCLQWTGEAEKIFFIAFNGTIHHPARDFLCKLPKIYSTGADAPSPKRKKGRRIVFMLAVQVIKKSLIVFISPGNMFSRPSLSLPLQRKRSLKNK